ncbi:MAG TPA: DUF4212 domain-containing protein [Candidatus Sumerlaeota bacterium]|nr:MAG: hypothetical protein BWZ08_00462 [candidate division BRC1 bacterium ADurb.BinA292]HOE97138.1 DUF4212 domain-containing protein [Candidatus Sumerlaeota bacterium]HOR27493.1 DUF4212 domain-containing protein [Candidatus Sumerlaeota bacterium]HPK01009.1 DUF4212 domain-containing protein [Candidatus Sumerlaeota bacterium]
MANPRSETSTPSPNDKHRHLLDPYWRANQRLIWTLLAIWALVSLGAGILFVRQLNAIQLGGLPLGFFFAQQGSIYVFVLLIFFYAWRMDRLDHKFRLDVDADPTPPPQAH